MMTLVQLIVLAALVWGLSQWLPGIHVERKRTALVVAVVFSLMNWIVGGAIRFLVTTVLVLPAIFTFGLLLLFVPLIVNGALLWATDQIIKDFEIRERRSFWWMAFAITIVNWALHQAPRWMH